MGVLVDLTSMQFGFLRVDSRAESTDRRQARWRCTCLRCGRTKVILGYSLTTVGSLIERLGKDHAQAHTEKFDARQSDVGRRTGH